MDKPEPEDRPSIPLGGDASPASEKDPNDELSKQIAMHSKSESERLKDALGPNSLAEDLKRLAGGPNDPLRSLRSTLDSLNLPQNKSLTALMEASGKAVRSFGVGATAEILRQPETPTIDFRPPTVRFDTEFRSQTQEQLRLAKSTEELARAALEATNKRHEEERLDAIANSRELRKARRREWIGIGIAMLFGIIGAWEPVAKWFLRL